MSENKGLRVDQMLYNFTPKGALRAAFTIVKHRKDLQAEEEVDSTCASVLKGTKPAYMTLGSDEHNIAEQFTEEQWESLVDLADESPLWSLLFTEGKNYNRPDLSYTEMWFAPAENIETIIGAQSLLHKLDQSNYMLSKVSESAKRTTLDALNQALAGVLLGYPVPEIARFVASRIKRFKSDRLINSMFGTSTSEGYLDRAFR